jgi:hypothetical protein
MMKRKELVEGAPIYCLLLLLVLLAASSGFGLSSSNCWLLMIQELLVDHLLYGQCLKDIKVGSIRGSELPLPSNNDIPWQ